MNFGSFHTYLVQPIESMLKMLKKFLKEVLKNPTTQMLCLVNSPLVLVSTNMHIMHINCFINCKAFFCKYIDLVKSFKHTEIKSRFLMKVLSVTVFSVL